MKQIQELSDREMIEGLLKIAPHATISSHVPGRIRLKISMEGVKALNGKVNGENPIRIPGIISTRINTFARSIIIEYDDQRIPYELWERLGHIRNHPGEAQGVVKDLRRFFSGEDPATI